MAWLWGGICFGLINNPYIKWSLFCDHQRASVLHQMWVSYHIYSNQAAWLCTTYFLSGMWFPYYAGVIAVLIFLHHRFALTVPHFLFQTLAHLSSNTLISTLLSTCFSQPKILSPSSFPSLRLCRLPQHFVWLHPVHILPPYKWVPPSAQWFIAQLLEFASPLHLVQLHGMETKVGLSHQGLDYSCAWIPIRMFTARPAFESTMPTTEEPAMPPQNINGVIASILTHCRAARFLLREVSVPPR